MSVFFFFFQAEDGIRDLTVTGVQTCALPILTATRIPPLAHSSPGARPAGSSLGTPPDPPPPAAPPARSEEHTSELQSQSNLVCRLLLEKKKHTVERLLLIVLTTGVSVSPC